MTTLPKGTEVDAGDIVAPDALRGSPFVIDELLGEFAHGHRYRARQDNVPVLLTVLDPGLWADPLLQSALVRDIRIAIASPHRSLLPIHGAQLTSSGFLFVESDQGGSTVREFAKHREARGRNLDAETIYTLVAHVCNGLAALHGHLVHAYVTADTVVVSSIGRVFLSSCGIGPVLPFAPSFARFHRAGRLPHVTPEQLLSPPQLGAGTDVFGVATLFLELVTGLPLSQPGQPIVELGLRGPAELLLCLERATAPSPAARPPDAITFKAELADALRAGPLERSDPLAPPPAELAPASGMPPHPGAVPPGAPWPGYPPQAAYARGRPTPYPPAYPYSGYGMPPAVPVGFPPPPAATRREPEDSGPDRRPTPLQLQLEELERATRRLEDVGEDDALEVTSSVAAAVDPLALDVDEPLPPKGTTTSSSMLGLRLDAFDDVAARLSTIDGEQAEEAKAKGGVGPVPSGSGTYFGSMYGPADHPEVKAAPREQSEATLADSDQRPTYFIIRRGQDPVGPLSLYELGKRARGGELDKEDILRHRVTGEETNAAAHEALRKSFRMRAERQAYARGTPVRGIPLPAVERDRTDPAPGPITAPPPARHQARFELRSPNPEPARSLPPLYIVLAIAAVIAIVAAIALGS